ncbi:MAG: DEAD/DEAH box helicase [Clostridiales bacterium]|nr:DEAD/DEAH box helicase [Clostridiales bacterium]
MEESLFEKMNLIKPLLSAVEQCGYHEPTPIQRETIPPVLQGRDVLGCAQTGTGKTAAFALPILQLLAKSQPKQGSKRPIRALVLTPTRELALQIYENFVAYAKKLPLTSCVIFGGVGQQPQVDALKRGVDILVATPGRLNDLIGQGYISLKQLDIFVLDEADRMLDMGFIHDVKRVIAQLPAQRQTLLFSATMPTEVEKLALSILTDPVSVKVDPVSSTVDAIRQFLYLVDKANKKHLLADLLSKPNIESALVFTRTKHGADRVVRELSRVGIASKAIHGDKSQNARQEALSQFKKGKIRVLIATDIAARGIDIAGLSHVFNYDLPNEPEAYVHRIGRTGRAGQKGIAISFCCIDEQKQLNDIEKLIGKKLTRLESAWPMQVFTETVKQPRQGRKAQSEQPPKSAKQNTAKAKDAPAKEKEQPAVQKLKVSASDEKKVERKADKRKEKVASTSTEGKPDCKPKQARENKQQKPAQEKPPLTQPKMETAVADASPKTTAKPAEKTIRMKATPLERPVSVSSIATEKSPSAREEKKEKKVSEQTELSYQQYIANLRRQRGPLATGDDRR